MTAYIQSPEKLTPMGSIMPPIYVLVADENPEELVDISQMLGDMGYEVMTASSGSRAIALSTGRHIDIVLTSGHLPDMDGRSLMTEIKRNAGDRHIPVVAMVRQTDQSCLSEYIAAGGDDFLCKPVSREQMMVRMSAVTRYRDLRHQYTHYLREQRIIKQVIAKTVETCSEDVDGARVYSEPFAEVGGDMVLFGRLPSGDVVVLFSDFVGHGLSSAIGIFPVADVFSRRIAEGMSPRHVIDHINTKLYTILPTGMYMAACMLVIDRQMQHVQVHTVFRKITDSLYHQIN